MQLACGSGWTEVAVAALAVVLPLLAGAFIVTRRRGCCVPPPDPLERIDEIDAAFAQMDELDAREAPDGEYRGPMEALSGRLPSWAAAKAIERLDDPESPSRRRYLAMLERADIREERERLVEMARDVKDPLAADVWALLTGRPAGEWAKTLVASDGGDNDKEFLRRG